MRRYMAARGSNASLPDVKEMRRINFFLSSSTSASIVTYTNDNDRLRRFIAAVIALRGGPPIQSASLEEALAGMPYSVTETALLDSGVERTTRSPLGQFSTLLPLLIPDKSSPVTTAPTTR
jgi:hypothetical protein